MNNINLVASLLIITAMFFAGVVVVTFAQQQEPTIESKQITLSKNTNVQNISAYGQYTTDPKYTSYYKPENLIDNSVAVNSWWSQFGKSGFSILLKQPLAGEEVCNIDIEVAQTPQNSPFTLTLIDANDTQAKKFTGNLSSNLVKPDFEEMCIQNVKQIKMDINETSASKSNKIAELRLYTYVSVTPPPPDPTNICPPNEEWDETQQKCIEKKEPIDEMNMTKVYIENSNAEVIVSNSSVTINLDKTSSINLPNLNVPVQTVNVPPNVVEKTLTVPEPVNVTALVQAFEAEEDRLDKIEQQEQEQEEQDKKKGGNKN